MSENEAPKSRLRPPTTSRLKRPSPATVSTRGDDEKPSVVAPKKARSVAPSDDALNPRANFKKITKTTRRSAGRVRDALGNIKKNVGATSRTQGKVYAGKVAVSKSATKPQTSGVINKKSAVKRQPWDIKGKLEDMTELYKTKCTEVDEHKQKTKLLDDIVRRLECLEGEKQAIQVENSGQQGEISRLRSEISSKDSELSNKDSEIYSLRERNRILTRDLEERNSELRKIRLENQDLEAEIREEKKKCEELRSELHSTKEKYTASQNLNEKYEQDVKQYEIERKRLLNEVIELKGNIRVFCRVRPHLKDESPPNHINYSEQPGKSIGISNGDKVNNYLFDKVFDCASSQSEVFEELSQLVNSSLDGYNVCVFAYGQTGSGKTYTMEGPDNMTDETCGVIPRAMRQVFANSEERQKVGWEFTFHVEQLEIYCENVQDLLRPKNAPANKLEIRTKKPSGQSGIWVPDLSSHKVECYEQVDKLLHISKRRRATASTAANDYSSRSHSVFILKISATNTETRQSTESSLNLIDLAGSERCGSNGSTGMRFVEGTKINSSLTVLSTVITALAKKDSHIPYRSSKLTLLLSGSLGGNSKTLMIVNINPSPPATSESVNTLRFATMVNQCNIGTAQKVVKF